MFILLTVKYFQGSGKGCIDSLHELALGSLRPLVQYEVLDRMLPTLLRHSSESLLSCINIDVFLHINNFDKNDRKIY